MKRTKYDPHYVEKLQSRFELETATVYTYIITDELGNKQEITDLNVYQPGDRVELWFKGEYDRPGMRPYKENRK